MKMDCIPSGMEWFPAIDVEQFDFIKKIIDDSDYYLLIVGGRYGSVTEEGISYTEKEYHYAVSIGLKVIAFLYRDPDEIAVGKTDKNSELAARLSEFRKKIETNRLVQYWRKADELPGLVALSLLSTMKMYPAIGWVRANQRDSAEILNELNEVRKENEKLQSTLAQLQKTQVSVRPVTKSTELKPSNVTVVDSEGLPVEGASIIAISQNGTIKKAITSAGGEAVIFTPSQSNYDLLVAHPTYAGEIIGAWNPDKDGKVTLTNKSGVGSVLISGAGYVPGIEGRLNPILDSQGRMYLYADNIAINGGLQQPVVFNLNDPLVLEDSNGVVMKVIVAYIRGVTSLVSYMPS
ncbi:putative protein containing a TIR (Toll-Interleukin 1-resistance) domain protein [Achromobacter xylosoxidans]|nr:putative protein containing a TIR (Toll-Interleukin 1-resistance) domain protein [Achromobacter xylosoxidans]